MLCQCEDSFRVILSLSELPIKIVWCATYATLTPNVIKCLEINF
jgi:hypothetical protein